MDNKTRALNRLGEKFITNEGLAVEIVEYFNSLNCTIKYEDGTISKNKIYEKLRAGKIKNPYRKAVYNIGYIGEGIYPTAINSKHTEAYQQWTGMLRRCYDKKFHQKHITYKECTTCTEWHNFQNFAKWFSGNYIAGYCLDKDILFKGNKLYSPQTCCFVPQEINKLLQKSDKTKRKYPLGVRTNGVSFQASMQIKRKFTYLGSYDTIEDAFSAYRERKRSYIKEIYR